MNKFKIALFEPEIPQNTGNIARLCACTNIDLCLIGKLGFSLSDKYMKRAGLDYWEDMNVKHLHSIDELIEENPDANIYFLSTKAKKLYTEQTFKAGDIFVFGSESKGLPEEIIKKHSNNSLKVPMKSTQRSLNLSNTAAIVAYEAIRQTGLI